MEAIKCVQSFALNVDKILAMVTVPRSEMVVSLTSTNRLCFWKMDLNGKYCTILSNVCPNRCFSLCFDHFLSRVYVGQDGGTICAIDVRPSLQRILGFNFHQVKNSVADIMLLAACSRFQAIFCVGYDRQLSCLETVGYETLCSVGLPGRGLSIQLNDGQDALFVLVEKAVQLYRFLPSEHPKLLALRSFVLERPSPITSLYLYGHNQIAVGFAGGAIHLYDDYNQESSFLALESHRAPIVGLHQVSSSSLLSVSNDGHIMLWDMKIRRLHVKRKRLASGCAYCPAYLERGFLGAMNKLFNVPRVNCTLCGGSFCSAHCCTKTSSFEHGIEVDVLVCQGCAASTQNRPKRQSDNYRTGKHCDLTCYSATTRQLFLADCQTPIQQWDLSSVT